MSSHQIHDVEPGSTRRPEVLTVCAKDVIPGDILVLPWELQSNLVASVTEYKGSVKIETESDFWIGSENRTFTVSRKGVR